MTSTIDAKVRVSSETKGFPKAAKDVENLNNKVTRLGNSAAGTGRQFSKQADGLGGLVGAYAGAAATIFAVQQAFSALNKAASAENVVRGTRTLAATIGESGDAIIEKIQSITNAQLTMAEAAQNANLALSSGFSGRQIEDVSEIALKASRALGRNLTDAMQRLVRGAGKLEPELLDELGIFARIDPAVRKYAISLGVSATSLTEFERRQAFVNAVIEEGQKKFSDIDTSIPTAQESLEKFSATMIQLATELGGFLANTLAPFADFLSGDLGNAISSVGLLASLVFSKLKSEAIGALDAITKKGEEFSKKQIGFFTNMSKGFKEAGEAAKTLSSSVGTGFIGKRDIQDRAKNALKEIQEGTAKTTKEIQKQKDAISALVSSQKERIKSGKLTEATVTRITEVNKQLNAVNKQLDTQMKSTPKAVLYFEKTLRGAGRAAIYAARGVGFLISAASKLVFVVSIFTLIGDLFEKITGINIDLNIVERLANLFKELTAESRQLKNASLGLASALTDGVGSALENLNITADESKKVLKEVGKQFANITLDAVETAKAVQSTAALIDKLPEGSFFSGAAKDAAKFINGNASEDFTKNILSSIQGTTRELEAMRAKAVSAGDALSVGILDAKLAVWKELTRRVTELGGAIGALLPIIGKLSEITGISTKNLVNFAKDGKLAVNELGEVVLKLNGNIIKLAEDLEGKGITDFGKLFLGAEGSVDKLNEKLRSSATRAQDFSLAVLALTSQVEKLDELDRKRRLNADGQRQLANDKALLGVYRQQLKELKDIEAETNFISKTFTSQIKSADSLKFQNFLGDDGIVTSKATQEINQITRLTELAEKRKGIEFAIARLKKSTNEEDKKQLAQLGVDLERAVLAEKALTGQAVQFAINISNQRKELEKELVTLRLQNKELREKRLLTDSKAALDSIKTNLNITKQQLELETKLLDITTRRKKEAIESAAALKNAVTRASSEIANSELGIFFTDTQRRGFEISIANEELKALQESVALQEKLIQDKATNDLQALFAEVEAAKETAAIKNAQIEIQKRIDLAKISADQSKLNIEAKNIGEQAKLVGVQAKVFDKFINELKAILEIDVGNTSIEDTVKKDLNAVTKYSQDVINITQDNLNRRKELINQRARADREAVSNELRVATSGLAKKVEIIEAGVDAETQALDNSVALKQKEVDAKKKLDILLSNNTLQFAASAANGLKSTFSSGLKNVFAAFQDDTKSVGDAFKDMISNMLTAIQDAAIEKLIVKPISDAIFGSIGATLVAQGGLIHRAGGGGVPRMAAGGLRDSVPARLEPGEFVIRKPIVNKVGLPAMQQLNATGNMGGAGNVSVNLVNEGSPKDVEQAQPRFDGEKFVVDVFLRDLRNNGPIRRGLRSERG